MTTMNFTELDISAIAVGAGRTLTTATLSNLTLDGRRLEQRFRMDAGRCPFGSGKWHKPQVHCDGATADKWRALDRLVLGAVSARGDQDRFAYKNALREDETYGPSVEFKIDPAACRAWRLVDGNRTEASLDDLKGSTVVTIFRIAFLSQFRNNGGQSKSSSWPRVSWSCPRATPQPPGRSSFAARRARACCSTTRSGTGADPS